MSYRTVEVEIDHGRIIPRGSESLPAKGSALLTILRADDSNTPFERRPFGLAKGQFDVPEDFNAPLPEDVLSDFEGK